MAPPTLPWRTSRLDLVRAREIRRPLQEMIRHGVTMPLHSGYVGAAVQYQGAGRIMARQWLARRAGLRTVKRSVASE